LNQLHAAAADAGGPSLTSLMCGHHYR